MIDYYGDIINLANVAFIEFDGQQSRIVFHFTSGLEYESTITPMWEYDIVKSNIRRAMNYAIDVCDGIGEYRDDHH